jgi:hypothetical protein
MKIIDMCLMPDEVMLILEHSSGVYYENQVGGVVCSRATLEGVLAPIDIHSDAMQLIMSLPYDAGVGISGELADEIDRALAGSPGAHYLKVDRSRLPESLEAWVFVVADIPERAVFELYGPYSGAPRGFGRSTGVLTWPNSD